MKDAKINEKSLNTFLEDIRKEDKKELIYSFKKDYKKIFIETILKNKENSYLLEDDNKKPLAIGGIIKHNKYSWLVWLLVTNQFKFHKKEVFKYIFKKIELFKNQHDILFNFIYKSNFKSIKWLKKAGFKVIDLKDKNYKLFYFSKGGSFDLRHITC